jgi:hypothetical protein
MAKIYGQLEKAQLENLSADPTPASTGLTYWSTAVVAPRIYDGTTWQSIALGSSASPTFNIRASEGAGTTTLVAADNHNQRFNLSADRTVVLPTTTVSQGDAWTVESPNAFTLLIQASDLTDITYAYGTKVVLVALVNTPVTFSDWEVSSESLVNPLLASKYFVGVGTGSAGTNTAIATFSTVFSSAGVDVTYTADANLGDSFTINKAGVYSVSHTNIFNAISNMGISLNSNQLSTGVEGITDADALTMTATQASDIATSVSVTLAFDVGDVLRPHCSPGFVHSASNNRAKFSIQRIIS